MHIRNRINVMPHTVDEGACGGCRRILARHPHGLASSTVWHFILWVVGGGCNDSFAARCYTLNLFRLIEERCIFKSDIQRAFGTVEPNLITHLRVVGRGSEDEVTATGIGKDCLRIVICLSSVVIATDGSGAECGYW